MDICEEPQHKTSLLFQPLELRLPLKSILLNLQLSTFSLGHGLKAPIK